MAVSKRNSGNKKPEAGWALTATFWLRILLCFIFVAGIVYLLASYSAGSTWDFTFGQLVNWAGELSRLAELHPHSYVCPEINGVSKALPVGFAWVLRNVLMWAVELLTVIMVAPAIICGIFWVKKDYWKMANEVLGQLLTSYFFLASVLVVSIIIIDAYERSQCS